MRSKSAVDFATKRESRTLYRVTALSALYG
nr:MAG TPA: hypothetical protein [Bacteriophage sp.]